jgi:hypothetical protein
MFRVIGTVDGSLATSWPQAYFAGFEIIAAVMSPLFDMML